MFKSKQNESFSNLDSSLDNRSLEALSRSFARDERGVVAIIFALTATIVFGIIGGAVDYGRWLSASDRTLQAMDTAVLAAGRVLQINGATEAQAISTAEEYYNKNKSPLLTHDDVTFSVTNGSEITATSRSKIGTPFLSILGIQELRVHNISKAVLAAGGNSGTHIEISLMLDTTGSMRGSKMSDLKAAAKDLVNIVVWDDQSEYSSRVALAPFSYYVNVSRTYFKKITNKNPSGSGNKRTCVMERKGGNRYTDKRPSGGNKYFERYTGGGTCRPTSTIMPLTNDKTALKNAIDRLPATGVTAGHLGTAWAWYLISPEWSSIWPFASRPKPYSMMSELNDEGQPKLQKIAIIMTDGEYNRQYSGSNSSTQARAICANIKAKGITVYSVGFKISKGGTADTTMKKCASSTDHYYSADDGAALKSAFRDIALKISTLRLSE